MTRNVAIVEATVCSVCGGRISSVAECLPLDDTKVICAECYRMVLMPDHTPQVRGMTEG